jgi:ABC-2 type transport system permease protein
LPDLKAGPRWTIARRDIASLSREKTIVLALLIQLFIAGFSSVLVVGLTSPYSPDSADGEVINLGATGEANTQLSNLAIKYQEDVVVSTYNDRDEAIADFASGELDAVITSRRVPVDSGGTRIETIVIVPSEDIQTTPVVVSIRELLANFEEQQRSVHATSLEFTPVPVPTAAAGGTTPFFGFSYTILIPLLLFLPSFISGSLAVDLITEELERGTLELLRVAPVSLVDVVDGKAIGMVAIAPLQAALWLALLHLNGISIGNPASLLVMVTAVTTVAVAAGLLFGLVTGQRRRAQFLYSMLMIFLFGVASLLPEHPASTMVKLAADSATLATFAHVAAAAVVAAGAYALVRRYVTGLDPESL